MNMNPLVARLFDILTNIDENVQPRALAPIANETLHLGQGEFINKAGVACGMMAAYIAAEGITITEALDRFRLNDSENVMNSHEIMAEIGKSLGLTAGIVEEAINLWDDHNLMPADREELRKMVLDHLVAMGCRENTELNRQICQEFESADAETANIIR